jgi:hypothetical protein
MGLKHFGVEMFLKCTLLNHEIVIQLWAREYWSVGYFFPITPALQCIIGK